MKHLKKFNESIDSSPVDIELEWMIGDGDWYVTSSYKTTSDKIDLVKSMLDKVIDHDVDYILGDPEKEISPNEIGLSTIEFQIFKTMCGQLVSGGRLSDGGRMGRECLSYIQNSQYYWLTGYTI